MAQRGYVIFSVDNQVSLFFGKAGEDRDHRRMGEVSLAGQLAGVDWLKAQGASIHDVSLPHTKYALPAYYIVAPAEASSNLARYDGVRYGLREPGADLIETYEATRHAGFGAEGGQRLLRPENVQEIARARRIERRAALNISLRVGKQRDAVLGGGALGQA